MGNGKWACLTLDALLSRGHNVIGVVCETDEFDNKENEFYNKLETEGLYMSLKDYAIKKGLKVLQPENINAEESMREIENLSPEILISASYHQIIKKELINRYTIINAHGAPLPRYRGRAPIAWSIINGEKEGAVTVHFVDETIDTGDIILQKKFSIEESDYASDVLKKILGVFPEAVCEAVSQIENNTVNPTKQNPYDGWYFPKRTEADGVTNFNSNTKDVYNWIRAQTSPYPGAFAYTKKKKVIFQKVELPKDTTRISPVGGIVFGKTEQGGVKVTTKDGYITINSVIVGSIEKPASEYIRMGTRFFITSPTN